MSKEKKSTLGVICHNQNANQSFLFPLVYQKYLSKIVLVAKRIFYSKLYYFMSENQQEALTNLQKLLDQLETTQSVPVLEKPKAYFQDLIDRADETNQKLKQDGLGGQYFNKNISADKAYTMYLAFLIGDSKSLDFLVFFFNFGGDLFTLVKEQGINPNNWIAHSPLFKENITYLDWLHKRFPGMVTRVELQ